MRFPRLLKTSTLEPPKRNRARFPFDSLRGMARIRLISDILMLCLFSQKGHRPLALPLGELSPKATERGKAVCRCQWQIKACRFLNDKINLFALSVLAALGHLSQGGEARDARGATGSATLQKCHKKAAALPHPTHSGRTARPFCRLFTSDKRRVKKLSKLFYCQIKKTKCEGRTKKHNKNDRKCSKFVPCFFVQF